jgi:hypothetical protein
MWNDRKCVQVEINVRENRRDNPETLATLGTQDEGTIQRDWQHWVHRSKTNNPERLATLGTQDEDKQSRDTGNIGYTGRRQTIQRDWQHWVHRSKTNNPERLAT